MANRVASPIFVGRRHELNRVQAALARAADGNPAFVLVAGEAGVGKTRFVHELTTAAEASGARVLEGGCLPLGGENLPFGAVIEALRGLNHELSREEIDRLAGSGRMELARLMPDVVRDDEPIAGGGPSDSSGQGRLFEHLLRFLERLADRAPLILLIEDIHWADRSTLELLDFLARNLRHGPIGLFATYRNDELHRSHPLVPFLAEVERSGRAERVTVARFDRLELATLAEAILGVKPAPQTLEPMAARSQGNAFYAEELLASEPGEGQLPETLREVLMARLAGLSQPTQELLRLASAAGPRIPTGLLATVIGTSEEDLQAPMREAVAHQVLVPQEDLEGERFAFRHALIQEAVYSDLLPGERIRLHGAFARALDTGGVDASRSAELAYHSQAANDLPRAFDAWIEAGIAAEAIYAFAEAGQHFNRALDLWELVADAAARAPFDRVELLMRAAADLEGSAPALSLAHVRTALTLVDGGNDPVRAGLLQARLGDCAIIFDDGDAALAAYREAVRLVPSEPPSAARAHVLTGLSRCLWYMNVQEESMSACKEAVLIARAAGAGKEESAALIPLAYHLVGDGEVETGLAHARRARELSAELGDVFGVARALTSTSGMLLYAGLHEEAVTICFEAFAYAERHGLAARFGPSNLQAAARCLVELGRWDEAADALDRSERVIGIHESVVADLLLLEARRGKFEAAGRRAEWIKSQPKSPFYEDFRTAAGLAELALWQGDPSAARDAIRARMVALDTEAFVAVIEVGSPCSLGLRAEADLAGLARTRRSEPMLREARSIGGSLLERMRSCVEVVAADFGYYMPAAHAWLALCEAEYSRLEGPADPDLWAAAAGAWDEFGNPYHAAYALMREAEAALAAPRDRERASRALSDAREIAVRLGAEPLRRAIDALARRPGIRVSGRRMDGLSPREQEVLWLVAAGRSNSEIGEALFISKKTASVHVANIKAKLGAQSRIGIVTSARGLGLMEARQDSA